MAIDVFFIDRHDEGRRLDRILRLRWPDVPLGAIAKALRTGAVRLDGQKTEGGEHVREGQEVSAPWSSPNQVPRATGSALPLDILLETPALWAVNKPAGLLVQPDDAHHDSVATRAWAREEASTFRPTPVHRLDRNTSGVLLVARSGLALRALQEAWRQGRVRKIYWAVLWGDVENLPDVATLEFPLRKDPQTNTVFVTEDGASSRTVVCTLLRRPPLALVALRLETGRPHQARVHTAAWGYPIWGDRKYGVTANLPEVGTPPRPLLHAREVVLPLFPPPREERSERVLVAPVPEDFLHFFGPMAPEKFC